MTRKERSARFERGLATRRAVVGDHYVDKALAEADDYSWPMQQLITEYCWDEIWNRPGLSHKDRSMLNLGMVAALGRTQELKAHVRGALVNGWTEDELLEVFMQVTVYCGVPAGVDSFRVVQEVLKERKAAASAG